MVVPVVDCAEARTASAPATMMEVKRILVVGRCGLRGEGRNYKSFFNCKKRMSERIMMDV